MNKTIWIILGGLSLLITVVGIGIFVYFRNQPQDITPSAQTSSEEQSACTAPGNVSNLRISYPHCNTGNTECSLTQANCSWSAASGAANYNVKITEVDSGRLVGEEVVTGGSTNLVFPVNQGSTYRCVVSARNSCNVSGAEESVDALCSVQGILSSPTPVPSVYPAPIQSTPTPTPRPSVTPTPTPRKVTQACAYTCASNADCSSGLICITSKTGQGYCGQEAYQEACADSPSYNTCCSQPKGAVVMETPLPESGSGEITVILGVIGGVLAVVGAIAIFAL